MQKTLSQILQDIGAEVDQDTTLPTGTELTTRINLVNQSQDEWAESYQWKALRVPNTTFSFALSGTSVALPANFKKMLSPLRDVATPGSNPWQELRPEDRFNKLAGDTWFVQVGNDAGGKALILSGMPSGASLVYDYQSYPSSLATLADVSVCPQPDFLVKKTISRILRARSDTRFPLIEQDAQLSLSKMIEEDNVPSGAQNNRVRDWARTAHFRIGE